MSRVGIVSLSDGRDFVSPDLRQVIREGERSLAGRLRDLGHEVSLAPEIVETSGQAVRSARAIADERCDLTIFHIAVWAFPHFTMLAAAETPGPLLLFSPVSPEFPGMVGMLAAAGALDQIGRPYLRAWGDIGQPEVLARVAAAVGAGAAVRRLRGSTFGRIGGRPMGMYTAVADPDQWIAKFGIDVEEIDQWELVRRSERVEASRARAGREWLERHAAGVHYDGRQLTPELLERQVRSYHAMQSLIEEWDLDFTGIKAQPELTTHFATMDVTEAFLNDPYDWEGTKPVHVCATEADMDGALTMQVLHTLSGTPALFADLRYWDQERDVWDLCNSGQHATWYAARADDPAENLRHVHLFPEGFYFPAGGASVRHLAAPGACTFARLTRLDHRYRLQVLSGELVQFDEGTNEALMRRSTYEWPHAFARFHADGDDVLSRYGSNHIHAVPGDRRQALRNFCHLLDIDYEEFGSR